LKTPRAAIAIPACGDDHFRVRRWQSPHAAFFCPPFDPFPPSRSAKNEAPALPFWEKAPKNRRKMLKSFARIKNNPIFARQSAKISKKIQ
jgi:hypothetical protein